LTAGFRYPAFGFRNSDFRKPEALNSLRGSQLRASRPRIAIALFFRCRYRLLGQSAVVHVLNTALAEGILYDAVFERMKTDHHNPPAGFQNLWRYCEQRLQIVQFAVYENSKSLKSSRRGMNSSLLRIHWPGRG
jgi:hypothetical protein